HLSCGTDRHVRLSVTDNGRGMPMNRPRGTHAFGLRGMSERVRAVGGHLRVEGRPGAGTSVDVVVPLDGQPNGVAN
ncbi:MAG: sensor histidine kinase, partial [Leptothrix sp. (in: b-proteobacteria)]